MNSIFYRMRYIYNYVYMKGLSLLPIYLDGLSLVLDMVDETDRSLAAIYGDAAYHVSRVIP